MNVPDLEINEELPDDLIAAKTTFGLESHRGNF
jgi:hypothetical protein